MHAPLSRPILLGDRYTLVRQMATGGMAEIFLARQKSLAGFDKEIVVKLLKDRYRNDPRVVAMFMNEARIGAVLNHPNIVHVYDVGTHEQTPFIAMELIHGEELSQLCRRGLELGRFLPLEHAVDLMRQAAEGMGHFHSKRLEDGASLSVVHRDISPSNMLVTRDGVLKLIDFGIARADWPDERRDPEDEKLVPGKYNYMSPEQVRGERVDHRSDVFSLGIVLYEITVGKRLFKGRPEEVIQKITRGRIKPPTFVRRNFPAALEHIIMRALETHRDDRYASAYELASELEEFLRDAKLKSGPVRIAKYLDDLNAAEGAERRAELVLAGEVWMDDDDGEDALDFDRDLTPGTLAPAAAAPAPSAAPALKPVPAPAPVPVPAPAPASLLSVAPPPVAAKPEPVMPPLAAKPTPMLMVKPTPVAPQAAAKSAPAPSPTPAPAPAPKPLAILTPPPAAAPPLNGKNGAHHLDDAPTTVSEDHEPTTVQTVDPDMGDDDLPTDTALPLPMHMRPSVAKSGLPIPAPAAPTPAPMPPAPVQGELLDKTDPVQKVESVDIDMDVTKTIEDSDALKRKRLDTGKPIDLMLPEHSHTFGASIVDRRRGVPWLLILAIAAVIGVIIFLATR